VPTVWRHCLGLERFRGRPCKLGFSPPQAQPNGKQRAFTAGPGPGCLEARAPTELLRCVCLRLRMETGWSLSEPQESLGAHSSPFTGQPMPPHGHYHQPRPRPHRLCITLPVLYGSALANMQNKQRPARLLKVVGLLRQTANLVGRARHLLQALQVAILLTGY
jgi:hypothetical protein